MEVIKQIKTGFYNWIHDDVKREVNLDFHYLRQIKGQTAIVACHYFDSLNPAERLDFAISLSNKFLTERNSEIIEKSPKIIDRVRWDKFARINNERPFNQENLEEFYENKFFKKTVNLNRNLLGREVKAACEPCLGKPTKRIGSSFFYKTKIRDFIISTEIKIGGLDQLTYCHSVNYDNGSNQQKEFLFLTNFLRWLGIGEIAWNYITDEDIPNTVSILSDLCGRFMEGIQDVISDAV